MADRIASHYHDRSGSAELASSASDTSSRTPNPVSSLLQDAIRQEKTNRRLSRALDSDPRRKAVNGNGLIDRDIQSSPISSASGREAGHERRSSAMGGRITSATRGMGAREMEEHVSKLNKQNFDLKLEVFHRRQRNEALEKELEKTKALEADNAELQSINEELVKELELRDVAVKEAVALICELEAKVEGAELRRHLALDHGLEANGTGVGHTAAPSHEFSESPRTPPPPQYPEDQLSPLRQSQALTYHGHTPSKTLGRTPSFLRDQKPSTSALRSVYQSDGNPSYISLNRAGSPLRSNDPDSYTLNSPSLSMLSESSFLSVYGKSLKFLDESEANPTNYEALEGSTDELEVSELIISRQRLRQASSKYHHNGVSDDNSTQSSRGRTAQVSRDNQENSNQTPRNASSGGASNRSFKDRLEHVSVNQGSNSSRSRDQATSKWLDQSMSGEEGSPIQQREPRQRSSKSGRKSSGPAPDINFSSIGEVLHKSPRHKLDKIPPLPSLGGPLFGGRDVLPPTPDTMGTQKEANSSTQSIITQKSLRDFARFPAKNVSAMIPDDRPRTASSLGLELENDADDSDDEENIEQAQQSETHIDSFTKESLQPSFPFMSGGSSSKAMQTMNGKASIRPSLKSYATNVMFDGDGLEDVQPSRGMSYPSPTSEGRRRSIAYTPSRTEHARTMSTQTQFAYTPSRPEHARSMSTQMQLSPHDRTSSNPTPTSNTSTTTPSKPSLFKSSPLKPSSSHRSSIMSSRSKDSSSLSEAPLDSKLPRTTSLRFGLGAIKSKFGRSTSYSSTGPLPAGDGKEAGQQPSRIARPGTNGSGGAVGSGLGGIGRSTSLRLKDPFGSRRG